MPAFHEHKDCVETLPLDVTDAASLLAAAGRIVECVRAEAEGGARYASVVLFNNAGIAFDVPMFFNPAMADRLTRLCRFDGDVRPEMARQTLAVNFTGAFAAMRELFVPVAEAAMRLQGGGPLDLRIVVTASGAGRLNLGRLLSSDEATEAWEARRKLAHEVATTTLNIIIKHMYRQINTDS